MNNADFSVTAQSIARASNVCAKLSAMFSTANKQEQERLVKCNGADEMYDAPIDTLMSEDSINQSTPAFMALAAFVGEAVEGIQNALKIQEAKLDAILQIFAENTDVFAKANQDTLNLLKASMQETPAEQFTQMHAPLRKANLGTEGQLNIPKSFIMNQLEKMEKEGKISVVELSKVEAGGQLRDDLREIIEATWRETH